MQNTLFLVLLRPIFALKAKIAPPIGIGNKNMPLDRKRICSQSSIPTRAKTFFGLHLILDKKNCPNLGEDLFFGLYVMCEMCQFGFTPLKHPPFLLEIPGYAPDP